MSALRDAIVQAVREELHGEPTAQGILRDVRVYAESLTDPHEAALLFTTLNSFLATIGFGVERPVAGTEESTVGSDLGSAYSTAAEELVAIVDDPPAPPLMAAGAGGLVIPGGPGAPTRTKHAAVQQPVILDPYGDPYDATDSVENHVHTN